MKRLLALLITLSMPLNSFAVCTDPVKLLEEGTPAPCRGFLFTPEKELQVRIMKKQYDLLEAETTKLNEMVSKFNKKDLEFNKIIELQAEKTELWKTRAEDITLKYVSVEDNRTKRDFSFILMGIGLTVLSAWAVGQASR